MEKQRATVQDYVRAAHADQASLTAQICPHCGGAAEPPHREQMVLAPGVTPRWLQTCHPYGVRPWFDWHRAVFGVFAFVGMTASVVSFFVMILVICHNLQK